MATLTLPGVLLTGDHAGRPAANAVGTGALYACSTHSLIYQSDGSSWSTWATLTGTGLSDPMTTRGDIIIRNASNVTARLGRGSAGQVLSSDGTDISWQTPATGGALVFLATQTASSSATLDFTSFISATYDDYEFHFINVVPATSGANLAMRFGTGGTPTYDTGSNYGYVSGESRAGGGATSGSEGGATSILLTRNGCINTANWPGINGDLRVFNPGGALYKPVRGKFWYPIATPFRVIDDHGGSWESTTAATAVRFFFDSGNISSGTIRVYGVAKS